MILLNWIVVYAFDEFGTNMFDEDVDEHEKSLQPFGYTGYQMDEVSGLYFAQARRYDAWNGRFVSKDSDKFIKITRPDSFNQYLYCDNNPEKYIDPSGNKYYIFTITGDEAVNDEAFRMREMLAEQYDADIDICEDDKGYLEYVYVFYIEPIYTEDGTLIDRIYVPAMKSYY